MTKEKKKRKISLNLKIVVITILAILVATGFYYECQKVVNNIIDEKFFTDEAIAQRDEKRLNDFKVFVAKSKVKSTDTKELKQWTVDEGYVYLSIYKDNQTLFDSGWKNDEPTVSEYDASIVDKDEEDYYSDCPVVKLGDGKFEVTLTDYSEIPIYYITNIAVFSASALIVLLFILLFIKRTSKRIIVFSHEVENIKNDIDAKITIKSNDELTELSKDVDNMRNTLISQLSAKQKAWQANSDLVTSMAHDLRTPLTVLSGYLELIKEKRYTDENQLDEYINISAEKADEIKVLSDKLFQYFYVYSESDNDYNLEEFKADELLVQIINEAVILMADSGYSFNYLVIPKDLYIKTDVKYLTRIFNNIFSNIRKYADKQVPIEITFPCDDKMLNIKFVNSISADRSSAESTCIGLKSCEKIAQGLGCGFTTEENGSHFTTVLSIPFIKKEG